MFNVRLPVAASTGDHTKAKVHRKGRFMAKMDTLCDAQHDRQRTGAVQLRYFAIYITMKWPTNPLD